ncbi:cytosolic carboxypeptidase 1-like isoform X2 [Maniola jurtina]|uniref:cytosolic carboxypeptidase 1-like isoform X2 n=1 Tax=Maniola jurtina TaxID=191418 RepID=UPI001E68E904|nr:cytosolic carboxypeptidase 1-like isoform X2 [Maniola jurtina]
MDEKCRDVMIEAESTAHTTQETKKPKKKTYRMADDAASDCLFERLRTHQQRAPDSAEVARAITSRINSRLTSHDKHIRQSTLDKLWNKQSGAIQMLLSILENSRDTPTSTYITSILREALCLKQGKGKKCSANNVARQQCALHFVSINGTQVVIRTLLNIHSKRDSNVSTELMMQDLVWVLAALAPRDPKFAMKVRMLGCVRTMHLILKGHFTDTKLIFPLLVILKQLAKNSGTTSILIRDGVIGTYERVLVSLGCIPTARLRLCLDAIDYFSKNKVCCMQIVKTGLCSVLIRVFDRWDRYEGRMRLKICAHILQTMQHLCNIKAGRRALCIKKHVQTLHRFCAQCPDEIEFDGLLARVCSVITLCLKHQALPVPANSPASFNLNPILKGTNTTWPCHEDDDDGANSDSKTINSDIEDDEPDSDTENIDEYPDIDFDNETEMKAEDTEKPQITKNGESLQSALWINPNEREIEDLKKYYIYFKEFGSYNKQIRLVKSRSNSRGSILDDIFNPQTSGCRNQTSPSALSLAGGIGSTDYDAVLGLSHTYSFLQGYHKVHESSSTTSCSSLKIHKDISKYGTFASVYSTISSRVRSIIPFVKVAYPDMTGGQGSTQPEPLNKMERVACRNKLLSCVERAINPESYMNEVVYDLDALCASNTTSDSTAPKSLSADNLFLNNTDEQEITKVNTFASRLSFESRFESGNLRKAIQVGPREYELILMPDVNSAKRHQWFYFEVRNMQQGRPYVFNVVNCEKSDSQFNFGMKPVMYSVKEAVLGKPGWVRAGSDICYYRNSYHYANQKNSKCYLTVTFTIEFPHTNDVCYLAYHFPFTYSMMMTRIWQWSTQMPPNAYLRAEPLCYSLNNNEVPLLTITADGTPSNPLVDREIIFLTARVHPGESNASWVMDGTLACLLADTQPAAALRAKYVFKIVPMLNVEGVINGCHRCGLTNEDLNRRWCKPSPVLHPSIYHTKGLIEYLVRVWKKPPLVYCDYHGHSRKKNVFFYGCAGAESWCSNDRLVLDEPVKYLMLPALMHRISPAFALGSCSFRVERERESTARVTVWRHLGVTRSYTMEASFCGFDRGPFKGFHLNTQHLQSVGSDFCEALNGLGDNASVDIQLTKDLNGNIIEIHLTGAEENSEIAVDSEPASGSDSVLKTDSDEDFD